MSTLVRGNRDLIKAMNRSLILNTLRREGVLSRTQLAEISGLSIATISQITTDLLQNHWISEIGEGEYTGGRRQTLMRLNPDAGSAIGLKLMENRVACTVTNLEGKSLRYRDYAYDAGSDPVAVSNKLAEIALDTLNSTSAPHGRLLGVGIGVAGIIHPHPQGGIVHYSPYFGWQDVPLAQMVQSQLNVPVYIENDVNTLTISEQLFGSGRHVDNFVVITIGRGIGMGIVINQRLHQGAQGGAGELGHITVMLDGPQCSCGKQGCLEAIAADPAIIAYVKEKIPNKQHVFNSLASIVDAAEAGNAICRAALNRSGEYIGMAVATVINLLAPQTIILSGEGVVAGDQRLAAMREAMRTHSFNDLLDDVRIVIEPTDDRMWARGAASLVISKVFESPLVDANVSG
ncbi:MAG: ROK family transcriptional regulator [Anaerolineae bacterium]|nr:ROK family transcriptional regulator [Anaerolineae bacterium]